MSYLIKRYDNLRGMDQDIKLIKGLVNKSEEAFDAIYKQYHNLVYYIVFQYIKNRESTEEIVNDVFVKMYNNIHQFDLKNNFKYWLLSIAKTTSLNYLKLKKRESVVLDNQYIDAHPSSDIEEMEIIPFIRKYLSEDESKIVIFIIVFNYKIKEVAIEMEQNPKTIASKYYRAVEKLKEHWHEYYD